MDPSLAGGSGLDILLLSLHATWTVVLGDEWLVPHGGNPACHGQARSESIGVASALSGSGICLWLRGGLLGLPALAPGSPSPGGSTG